MNSGRGTLDMSGRCKEAPPLKRNAERRVSLVLGRGTAPTARRRRATSLDTIRSKNLRVQSSRVARRRLKTYVVQIEIKIIIRGYPRTDCGGTPGVPPEGSRGYPRRYPRGYPQRPRLFKNMRVQNPVPSCSKTERSETSGRGTQSRRRLRPFFLTLLSSERHTGGFRGAGFAVI